MLKDLDAMLRNDKDFKDYVDKYSKKLNKKPEEILNHALVAEYAKYLQQQKNNGGLEQLKEEQNDK